MAYSPPLRSGREKSTRRNCSRPRFRKTPNGCIRIFATRRLPRTGTGNSCPCPVFRVTTFPEYRHNAGTPTKIELAYLFLLLRPVRVPMWRTIEYRPLDPWFRLPFRLEVRVDRWAYGPPDPASSHGPVCPCPRAGLFDRAAVQLCLFPADLPDSPGRAGPYL